MATHEPITSAKSLDELKTMLFPMLSQAESHNITKLGFQQVGANMADEAFNSLLNSNSEKDR